MVLVGVCILYVSVSTDNKTMEECLNASEQLLLDVDLDGVMCCVRFMSSGVMSLRTTTVVSNRFSPTYRELSRAASAPAWRS